ncbi:MAG: hypothetical protein ACI32Y_09635 [Clostridium sp.]
MGKVIQFRKKEESIEEITDKFFQKGYVLNYNITKEQVLNKDFVKLREFIDKLYVTIDGPDLKEKVKITFVDYEEDPRQIYEIPEIRDYIKELLKENFILFYMLSNDSRILFFLSCVSVNIEEEDDNKAVVKCEINEFMIVTIMAAAKAFATNEVDEERLTREMLKTVGYIKA